MLEALLPIVLRVAVGAYGMPIGRLSVGQGEQKRKVNRRDERGDNRTPNHCEAGQRTSGFTLLGGSRR